MAVELLLRKAGSFASLVAVDESGSRGLGSGSLTRLEFVRGRVELGLRTLRGRPADLEDATVATIGAEEAWRRGRPA